MQMTAVIANLKITLTAAINKLTKIYSIKCIYSHTEIVQNAVWWLKSKKFIELELVSYFRIYWLELKRPQL